MISLQALLAGGFMKNLPTIAIVALAVILVLAFIVGMVKGLGRVGKGGFYWAVSGAGFLVLHHFLKNKNPLQSKITGKVAPYSELIWALILLAGVLLVVLLICGICNLIFRPQDLWVLKGRAGDMTYEYEIDDLDGYSFNEVREMRRNARNANKPGVISRLLGGLVNVINVAVVLAAIAALAVTILGVTKLADGKLSAFYTSKLGSKLGGFADKYALDFLSVGIIFAVAYAGFKTGFMGVTRTVLKTLGILAVLGLAFTIPFVTKLADVKIFRMLIDKCISLYGKMESAQISKILGQLTAGAVMAIIGVVAILLVDLFLKFLMDCIDGTVFLRVIDGALATIIYLALGVALCAVVWCVLYVLGASEILNNINKLLDKTVLSKQFYNGAEELIGDFVQNKLLKWKK